MAAQAPLAHLPVVVAKAHIPQASARMVGSPRPARGMARAATVALVAQRAARVALGLTGRSQAVVGVADAQAARRTALAAAGLLVA
jgi:hypothetical protein